MIARLGVVAFLLAAALFGQGERATVTGTVTDSTQAVIPGASIALRNVRTNVAFRTQTNSEGIYYLPALPPGEYELTAERQGFRPARISGIPLSVGLTATVNAVLEVGTVTEVVEVVATAVQLESQSSGVGKTIETRRVAELPLLGRNPLQLASLAPGVIPTSAQGGNAAGAMGSATNARFSGGLAMQNAILMDGADTRGFTSSGQAYSIPIEAVEEVKIDTATYSAEFGRSGGGVLSAASRSGGNDYHGVGYEFLRNDHLNANGWQNNRNRVPRALFQRNQFGAAFGGRIIRDRTFFYANYEGIRSGTPDQFLATVPYPEQKQGDFTQTRDRNGAQVIVYDPLTTRANPAAAGAYLRDPFPGNRVPQGRVHPISAKVLPYWPEANRAAETPARVNNYYRAGKNVNPANIWFGRIDHILNEKHRLFGRTGGSQNKGFSTLAEQAFPSKSVSTSPTRTGLISLTSTFSPTLLGEFRISYLRQQFNSFPLSEGFDMSTLGFGPELTSNVLYRQFPQIQVQQYSSGTGLAVTISGSDEITALGGSIKDLRPQDTWHTQYHATLIRTRHKFKMGVEVELLRMNAYNSRNAAGQFNFDRVYTQGPDPSRATLTGGHGLASMLLGVPIAGALTFDPRMFLYQKYYGLYLQDDWRVTNRLTLNLGLRYEYTTPYAEKHGQIGYLDPNGTEPATGAKGVFVWAKPGQYHTDPNRKAFGPRVGLAYQLTSKTVIRSAGAIFHAANNGLNAAASDFGSGAFVLNPLTLGAPNPIPFTPPAGGSWSNPFVGGFLYPQKGVSTFPGGDIRVELRRHPLAYIANWSFSVQRMVNSTTLVEVGYVGSKITHLFWNRMENQNNPLLMGQYGAGLRDAVQNPFFGKVTTGPLSVRTVERRQLLRPYPQYRDVLGIRIPYGDASYQSMIARLEKQYSRGFTMSVAYTMSKTIASTAESNTWVVGPNNALYDPKYNRSIEANDTPHRLVISNIWELPFGKGRPYLTSGMASRVLGNWQLGSIIVLQAGRPVLITGPDQTNLFNFSYTHGRVDRLKSGVLDSGQTLDRWFDTTSFRTAAPYTLPTDSLSQPDLRGPGRKSVDLSLIKNVPFGERYNLQIRGEVFNLTNTPFFEARGTTTDVTNPRFGQIVTAGSPRNIQMGLRLTF